MRCQKIVVVASLLAAGTQAYAPIQMVAGPAKGFVVLPDGFPGNIRGTVTPQELSVGIPTASDSPSMAAYFTAKLDQTIGWDDMDWCVEAIGDKRGDAVRVNQCTGEQLQKWSWIPDGQGRTRIQLQNTNLCMDVDAEEVGLSTAPIELRDCGKEVTAWKFEELIPLPADSATDSWSYEARHVLITFVTLVGLGVASVGAWLWQRGEKKQQGSMASNVDQKLVPSVMFVDPVQHSRSGQTRAARTRNITTDAYKMTLETSDGAKESECGDDTYITDAAEQPSCRDTTTSIMTEYGYGSDVVDAQALLFDNDGTLVDTISEIYSECQKFVRLVGAGDLCFERYLQVMMDNVDLLQFLSDFAVERGCDVSVDRVRELFGPIIMQSIKEGLNVKPIYPTVNIVAEALRRGQKVAIVTAAPRFWAEATLRAAGIDTFFKNVVIIAKDTPGLVRQKPFPDPYLLAAAKLGVVASSCIGFEDSDSGLRALKDAGMNAVDVRKFPGYPEPAR